ncbi:MAG TPA: CheB methylesterase domain-containing protein [Kofleriaceae bacterium]|nr:CheB methylesterase domain-containing protein [Kofleriaceae bacterium]
MTPRARASSAGPSTGAWWRAPRLVVIGASTGGPDALATLLALLPDDLALPIAIAQHLPAEFVHRLAERLTIAARRPVTVATDDAWLRPGAIVLAPGDRHLEIVERSATELRTRLSKAPPVHHVRPAVDALFLSAAGACRAALLAIVLSGMGRDGTDGAAAITERGGRVLVQDEPSSVVWGMPGSIVRAGITCEAMAVPRLATELALVALAGRSQPLAVSR